MTPKAFKIITTLSLLTASSSSVHFVTQSASKQNVLLLRGGGSKPKKSKSSKKSLPAASENVDSKAKDVINAKMKDSDAATALGDAIRKQANVLLQDKLPYPERTLDAALVSLGLSLGTPGTDLDSTTNEQYATKDSTKVESTPYYQYTQRFPSKMSNAQYVPPSTSAVIANYFLKTHGGTHAIQCLLSLLASVLGLGCLILPPFPNPSLNNANDSNKMDIQSLSRGITMSCTKYTLLQQTLLLAMSKHASGLLGALLLGASKIPQLGIKQTRKHLESIASDPIGQYLFYCSCLVVWLHVGSGLCVGKMRGLVSTVRNAAVGSSGEDTTAPLVKLLNGLSQNPSPWYLTQSTGGTIVPIIMLLPILLREIISILWVVSDVLTLMYTTSGSMFLRGILFSSQTILDAVMSAVVTKEKWRTADSFQRQRTLAKLVSQCSLSMEVIMGGVLIIDAVQSFWRVFFVLNDGNVVSTLTFKTVLGKIVCAHLYLNFLMSRRRKIQVLVGSIRGGAFLDRVLDVLIDPRNEMGLVKSEEEEEI